MYTDTSNLAHTDLQLTICAPYLTQNFGFFLHSDHDLKKWVKLGVKLSVIAHRSDASALKFGDRSSVTCGDNAHIFFL